jgi:hypothetical protein
VASDDVSEARADERRRLARRLHDGLLQELTVGGLQLKSLYDSVPEPTKPTVLELTNWLAGEQARLRELVTELDRAPTPSPRPVLRETLQRIATTVARQFGCQLKWTLSPTGGAIDEAMLLPLRLAVPAVVRLLAEEMHGSVITIGVDVRHGLRLRFGHAGAAAFDAHPQGLARLARQIGQTGGTMKIAARAGRESLVVEWTS